MMYVSCGMKSGNAPTYYTPSDKIASFPGREGGATTAWYRLLAAAAPPTRPGNCCSSHTAWELLLPHTAWELLLPPHSLGTAASPHGLGTAAPATRPGNNKVISV